MSGSVRNALTAVLIVASTLLCRPRSIAGEQTNQSKFFLPQNPVAAAYVLGRLSNQELIDAPRGEFVDMALLQRRGLDRKYRIEALDGLATIRHSDRLTELLRAITELDKKGEESTGVIQELGPVLLQSNTPDLSSKRADLEKLALTAQLPCGRQLGWAARIVAGPKVDTLWGEASSNPARLEDMLLAIGLLPEPGLREPFFARIKGLLDQQAASSLTDAAAQALVSIRGHEAEAFATLASLVRLDRQSPAVLDSLSRIPSTSWPTNDLSPLAETILERLKKVPPEQRAQPAFANALQFETELATRLPNKENRKLTGELRSLGPVLISLHAVYEQMRFDKTFLVIEESRPVVITLQNDDAMPHNLAILAPGALQEIGQAAEKMPPEPDAEGRLYVPVSPKVLHATKLVLPGQSLRLAF
ncbi:MAG TPA: hypothetical protein VL793_03000, partial [Patescibacteria group bacterium]|nr:hypothetical protein [Patescibacteria group bacterium]